jgi:hypothetical protein
MGLDRQAIRHEIVDTQNLGCSLLLTPPNVRVYSFLHSTMNPGTAISMRATMDRLLQLPDLAGLSNVARPSEDVREESPAHTVRQLHPYDCVHLLSVSRAETNLRIIHRDERLLHLPPRLIFF